jgi:peptidyl-prolyl cis-trans isomerase A (cyclophilin A)
MTTSEGQIERLLQKLGGLLAEVEERTGADAPNAGGLRLQPAPAPRGSSSRPQGATIDDPALDPERHEMPNDPELMLALELNQPLSEARLEHIVDNVLASLDAAAMSAPPRLPEPMPAHLSSSNVAQPSPQRDLVEHEPKRGAAAARRWKASYRWSAAAAAPLLVAAGIALWSAPEGGLPPPTSSDNVRRPAIAPSSESRLPPAAASAAAPGPAIAPLYESPVTAESSAPSLGVDVLAPQSSAARVEQVPMSPEPPKGSADLYPKPEFGAADPKGGRFSLQEATAGLGGEGQLFARIRTEMGTIHCELWPEKAPLTVANFVGLARGLRPFKDPKTGTWIERPFYDGTTFHRVVPGFMIQAGDRSGTGRRGAGYHLADEIWNGAAHNEPGLLCMANRGSDTGSSQFFILDRFSADLSHLDASDTIFGRCTSLDVVSKIARVAAVKDRPVSPPKIQRVEIVRSPRGMQKAPPAVRGATKRR